MLPEHHDAAPRRCLASPATSTTTTSATSCSPSRLRPVRRDHELWSQLASDDRASRRRRSIGWSPPTAPGRDLRALTQRDPARARVHAAARGTMVFTPVEWLIGAFAPCGCRSPTMPAALNARAGAARPWASIRSIRPTSAAGPAGRPGCRPPRPTARMRAARPARQGQPGRRHDGSTRRQDDRIDAVGYLLGVGSWTAATTAALSPLRRRPASAGRRRAEHARIPDELRSLTDARLTRRNFLIASAGVRGARRLAAAVRLVTWPELPRGRPCRPAAGRHADSGDRHALRRQRRPQHRVPYADTAYHDARPDLAYAPSEVLRSRWRPSA